MGSRRKLLRGMKATETPRVKCLACGHALTRARGFDEVPPEVDDVSVCRYCGALARFNADLSLRPTTLAELHPLEADGALEALRILGFSAPD